MRLPLAICAVIALQSCDEAPSPVTTTSSKTCSDPALCVEAQQLANDLELSYGPFAMPALRLEGAQARGPMVLVETAFDASDVSQDLTDRQADLLIAEAVWDDICKRYDISDFLTRGGGVQVDVFDATGSFRDTLFDPC